MLNKEMRTSVQYDIKQKTNRVYPPRSREAVSLSSMKCQTCMPPRDAVPIRKDLVRPCCDAKSDRHRKTLAKKTQDKTKAGIKGKCTRREEKTLRGSHKNR